MPELATSHDKEEEEEEIAILSQIELCRFEGNRATFLTHIFGI